MALCAATPNPPPYSKAVPLAIEPVTLGVFSAAFLFCCPSCSSSGLGLGLGYFNHIVDLISVAHSICLLFNFLKFQILKNKKKSLHPVGVWSQARGFGYEVSFKRNENNSIIQHQLKLNGVKLGFMAQSQRFRSESVFVCFFFNLNL